MSNERLTIICGPTGVGKTDVSIAIAQHFNAEIISFDSRQFFIETNTGTAKPSPEQLSAVKHHFINSHHVWEHFSAGQFAAACAELINSNSQQRFIMAGGSGMYIDALINGLDNLPENDLHIRQLLVTQFKEKGIESLQQQLKDYDPEFYHKVDLNNPQRIMRALEVSMAGGRPYSSFLGNKNHELNFAPLYIGLNLERPKLYERINKRVDEMINNGLKAECESLSEYRTCNALKTVGYKEMFAHIDGVYSFDEAVNLIRQHTRNYAKRQLTWFRKTEIKWFEPAQLSDIIGYINKNLSTK